MEGEGGPQIPNNPGWPDIGVKAAHVLSQRKGALRDKVYLLLLHSCLLYYMQDSLMKAGVLSTGGPPQTAPSSRHSRHPSMDFILMAAAAREDITRESIPRENISSVPIPRENISSVSIPRETTNMDANTKESSTPFESVTQPPPEVSTLPSNQHPAPSLLGTPVDQVSDFNSSLIASHVSNDGIPGHVTIAEALPSPIATNKIPEDLTKLADLTLTDTPKKKITREDFAKSGSGGGLQKTFDPLDPLSNLDPLWSMK